jgi:hypothetical protein
MPLGAAPPLGPSRQAELSAGPSTEIDEVHPGRYLVAFTDQIDAQRGEQSLGSRITGCRTREQALGAVGASKVQ